MEAWVTVVVALIVALSTLGATFLTNRQSNKRFEKELERQREIDSHQWRRNVRSEPLLKLRAELVIMATNLDRLASSAHKLHTRFGGTEEEVKRELQKSVDDVNAYIESGNFTQTLFMQYDKELRDEVEKIMKDYRLSFFDAIHYKELKATKLGEAMEVLKKNAARIIEVQELINQRLEKL